MAYPTFLETIKADTVNSGTYVRPTSLTRGLTKPTVSTRKLTKRAGLSERAGLNEPAELNEATYSSKNIIPLLNKLGKVFGKQFGGAFRVFAPEKYKRTDGEKGVGYRLLNPQGHQMRINFQGVKAAMSEEFSKDAMYIKGIDYWAPDNDNWARASLNITFSRDCNILQIYKRLLQLIKAGKTGKYTLDDLAGDDTVTEATAADRANFLKSKGLKASMGWKSKSRFEQYAKEQGVLDEWYATIDTGAPETNSTSEDLKKADKQFEDTQYSDPDKVFQDIEDLTRFVAKSDTARSLIICGMAGVGKSLDRTTKVLVPGGYSEIGDLQVGDEVYTPKGKLTKVIAKYEHKDKELYEVKLNDGTSFKCDKDQIFHVEIIGHEGSQGIHNMTFTDLEAYLRKYPKRYATIPYCDPIAFEAAELPVDPYFLGLLIGDGCITSSTPALTNVDPDIITGVHKLVVEQYENMGMNFDGRATYKFVNNGEGQKNPLTENLRELGLQGKDSYTKFIPAIYKRSSIEQRMELLRGLMDSDGYIIDTGHTSYATCSKQLADDVVEIIRSLGGRARMREKHTKSQFGTPCLSYDISFKLPPELGSVVKYSKLKTERYEKVLSKKTWCKKRRIESILPCGTGDTACIAVEDEGALYLIDGFLPVHNTHHVTTALKAFGKQGIDYVLHGAMQVTPNSFFKTIFEERNRVVCFDEADAILSDKDIVVMLKPLLDTSGDHRAEWSIQTAPMALHSDDEIRAYCDNLTQGVLNGELDAVWSRSVSDAEREPVFFEKGGYKTALASMAGQGSEGSNELSDAVDKIFTEFGYNRDEFVKQLAQTLVDKDGNFGYPKKRADKVAVKIADNIDNVLSSPLKPEAAAKDSDKLPTARYPSIFFFDGKMIFISNMRASKLDPAVLSRSMFVDVWLRATDVRNRIATIVKNDPSFDDVREPLLDHLKRLDASTDAVNQTEPATYTSPALRRNGKQLTVRYVKIVASMIRCKEPNWEQLAAQYC